MSEYKSRFQSDATDELFDVLLQLKDRNECYSFFEDVCTITEINSIAQRWGVAKLLDQGITYHEIAKTHNVSSATIYRVNRCLSHGAGGYRLMLDRVYKNKK